MNIIIYNEGMHDKQDWMKAIYPEGIHGALKDAIKGEHNITVITLDNVTDITRELLASTDVMLWWGHAAHHLVPDEISTIVTEAVQKGMGFIALHSAHMSKPLRQMLGTSCTLKWRDDDSERIWVTAPAHPIAQGLPEYFELPDEEMYGEYFDIPKPDDVVFMGWFNGGEVFRSGVTFTRGLGKIFYFQPGHEAYPIYFNPYIQKIINNAVEWASPTARLQSQGCPNPKPLGAVQK